MSRHQNFCGQKLWLVFMGKSYVDVPFQTQIEGSRLFQKLTTSINMMGGANASLENLIITWANFIYLYNHNMQKMNVYLIFIKRETGIFNQSL